MNNRSVKRKKILILYFELAGYVLACIERLAEKHDVSVTLVRYPVNPVAPFQIMISDRIHVVERKGMADGELVALARDLNPDLVFVCGWSDKGYMAVAKDINKKIPVILAFDNPWLGTIKQKMASLAGPLYLKKLFTHCWVPGEPNAVYARKLGFNGDKLLTGMYSADVELFRNYYQKFRDRKKQHFPHRFIYVGRYTKLKGILELWNAFTSLSKEESKDWELWCLGKGEEKDKFPDDPRIKDCGFIQPAELESYIGQTGVFILPTHYEHWGVVVHEFAAAGFPMVCSTKTSAATAFLKENENGYFTIPQDQESIRKVLLKIIALPDDKLTAMGNRSTELADTITPDTWADTLWNLSNLN